MTSTPTESECYTISLISPKDTYPRKPKRKKIDKKFLKRQQARQWCRNHWYQYVHDGMEINHPDGSIEIFNWEGTL